MAEERKRQHGGRTVTRRRFLAGSGAAIAAAATGGPLILVPGKAKASEQLVVTSWGGAYEEGIKKVFAEPFTKETGIPITTINNADLAKVKAQVTSGAVEWDVFDGIGPQITAGAKNGYWEPVDASIVDRSDLVVPGGDTFVGVYFYGGGVCWDNKRHPDGKHPVDFKGFWDVNAYPGPRALRARIPETLEMALIADGVEPRKLYPLDVERGFRSLDRIKPHIKKWVVPSPQTISLVQDGEVNFSYTYISRVVGAERAGSPIGFSYKQTLNSMEYFAVVKGSKNREAAMKFIAFCLRPDRQAAFADLLSFTPIARKGYQLASPEGKKHMADLESPNNGIIDDQWWRDHFDELTKRFTEWTIT